MFVTHKMIWENWIKFLKDPIKGYKITLTIHNGSNFAKTKNILLWIMYIYNNSLNLRWLRSLANIFFQKFIKKLWTLRKHQFFSSKSWHYMTINKQTYFTFSCKNDLSGGGVHVFRKNMKFNNMINWLNIKNLFKKK